MEIEVYIRKVFIKEKKLCKQMFFSVTDSINLKKNLAWFDGSHTMYIPGYLEIKSSDKILFDFEIWDYPFFIFDSIYPILEILKTNKVHNFSLPFLEGGELRFDSINNDYGELYFIHSNLEIYNNFKPKVHIKEFTNSLLRAAINLYKIASDYNESYKSRAIKLTQLAKGVL